MKTIFSIQKPLTFLSLLLTLIFLNACKNGSEEEPEPASEPEITITSPANGATYYVDWGGAWPAEERMPIQASITSSVNLAQVRILINNSDGNEVFEKSFEMIAPNQNELQINELYYSPNVDEFQLTIETADINGVKTTSAPVTFYFSE